MSRANAITLNSSPISCSLTSFCASPRSRTLAAAEQLDDAAVDQEARLRGVAEDLEAGLLRGQRDAGEVDVRGDVLRADVDERLGVGAVRAMAHQRAARALRVVVLGLGKAVVDEEGRAAPQALGQAGDEASACGCISVVAAGAESRRRPAARRSPGRSAPGERRAAPSRARRGARRRARASAGAVEMKQLDRHRVEHLVADDHARRSTRASASSHRTLVAMRRGRAAGARAGAPTARRSSSAAPLSPSASSSSAASAPEPAPNSQTSSLPLASSASRDLRAPARARTAATTRAR